MHAPVVARDKVELVGHYTNMVVSDGEDPHFESGYNLSLYRKTGAAFGTLAVAIGTEEPVTAKLQGVTYDIATKKLTFQAAYSEGIEFSKNTGPNGREGRTLLNFSGTVTPAGIAGQVTTRDGHCDTCKPKIRKVSLKKTPDTYVDDFE